MKLSRDCGLPFGVSSLITCLLEVILSGLVIALSGWSWIREGKPTEFFYSFDAKDSYIVKNKKLEDLVVLWCLSTVCVIGIWRIISAMMLLICAKKRSASLGLYWIFYKGLVLCISSFAAISSLTVSQIKYCAMASFAIDVITVYFIVILHPEIGRMQRTITILLQKDDEPHVSNEHKHKVLEA